MIFPIYAKIIKMFQTINTSKHEGFIRNHEAWETSSLVMGDGNTEALGPRQKAHPAGLDRTDLALPMDFMGFTRIGGEKCWV